MKKNLACSLVTLFLLMFFGSAHAALETIGKATYNGSDYNLIWDDNNNGNSLVWLDYSNEATNWTVQNNWAKNLDSALTINLNSGYSVNWTDSSWRLPSTEDGQYVYGKDGTTTAGYNITSSEMGHLFYTELGNKGYFATDGTYPQPGYGLNNTEDFYNLVASWYWSGTEYAVTQDHAWYFHMNNGNQGYFNESVSRNGLAVRSGQVSTSPVPVPGAIFLLGSGLVGLQGSADGEKEIVVDVFISAFKTKGKWNEEEFGMFKGNQV